MKRSYIKPDMSTMAMVEECLMATSFVVDKNTEIEENFGREDNQLWEDEEE